MDQIPTFPQLVRTGQSFAPQVSLKLTFVKISRDISGICRQGNAYLLIEEKSDGEYVQVTNPSVNFNGSTNVGVSFRDRQCVYNFYSY